MSRHRVPQCSLFESLQRETRVHACSHTRSGVGNGVSAICRTVEEQERSRWETGIRVFIWDFLKTTGILNAAAAHRFIFCALVCFRPMKAGFIKRLYLSVAFGRAFFFSFQRYFILALKHLQDLTPQPAKTRFGRQKHVKGWREKNSHQCVQLYLTAFDTFHLSLIIIKTLEEL